MSLLYSDSIVQPIFIEPFLTLHANKLCVLSEHASPNMAYVTAADLRSYGRTDVTFIKIDEEHYYMDFSI